MASVAPASPKTPVAARATATVAQPETLAPAAFAWRNASRAGAPLAPARAPRATAALRATSAWWTVSVAPASPKTPAAARATVTVARPETLALGAFVRRNAYRVEALLAQAREP